LKINKLYYKHLFRSLLIVILGMTIVYLVVNPMQAGDMFVALLLYILCAFFGIVFGPAVLFLRIKRGVKYRRRFIYCLIGTINFCLGIISLPFALRIKEKQVAAIIITLVALLIGAFILIDIFFGKREPKPQQEYLSI
jgi:predicted MFS family arabinose efflux permease